MTQLFVLALLPKIVLPSLATLANKVTSTTIRAIDDERRRTHTWNLALWKNGVGDVPASVELTRAQALLTEQEIYQLESEAIEAVAGLAATEVAS